MALLSSRLAPLTVSVPAMSEWVSYTPTGNITTNATYTGKWRRVGDSIELSIQLLFSGANTQGAFAASDAQLLNGLGLTVDASKLATSGPDYRTSVGTWTSIDSGISGAFSGLVTRTPGPTYELAYPSGINAAQIVDFSANRPFTISANDAFSLSIRLPITGWTSHTASATAANALVVGGQSVGSTLSFGATSNQGFSILANNVSVLSSTAAGALTLGPTGSVSTSLQHILNLPAANSYSNITNTSTGTLRISSLNATGTPAFSTRTTTNNTQGMFFIAGTADTNNTVDMGWQVLENDNSDFATQTNLAYAWYNGSGAAIKTATRAGAWTLGPASGNSLTHTINGGNVSARATMGYATAGTYRFCIGPESNTNDNGFAKSWQFVVNKAAGAGANTELSFQVHTGFDSSTPFAIPTTNLVNTGSINAAGAWTLGPMTGTTNTNHQSLNRSTTLGVPVHSFIKGANDTTTGNYFVLFQINNGAANSGAIAANGANQATFVTISDRRLKENIEDLPSQLGNILSLRPVEFDYKTGGHQIGFIAQEMQEVYPHAVNEGADGMLTVGGWDKTSALLVKAIQELNAKVEALEAQLNA